ncbi:MAG: NAD(P)-dependent oxidoreductase [Kofleriaceae bacterium]
MKLLFCGSGWFPIIDRLEARLPASHALARWDRRAALEELVGDVEVLLPSNAHITRQVLERAPKLRLIQQPAVGTEAIDVAAARALGIPVCNMPGMNTVGVAEAALFLMLALARRYPAAQAAFRAREIGAPLGRELAGRTLGVIGPGGSGQALATRARALGMDVQFLARGASEPERDAFFSSCDVFSVHCPLTPETRGLIGARALGLMRRGAHLVNVARGGVLDRDAVLAALRDGVLGGLGLDVHWEEPWDPDDELYQDPRVVPLPHVAGSTEEAADRIIAIVLDNLGRLERGEPLRNLVEPPRNLVEPPRNLVER